MKFQGQAVLVYLEEDNITKAYFRIRPLLTQSGPVTQEELNSFPDEGYLRIVPDKNEQHTFKERMRAMCGLCMLDLRNQPAEANKIRTNKNYNPSKCELNQFIVYSDAVQAIAPGLFYQVVSESDLEKAATPEVYVRSGANMQGPVTKGASAADASQLPPDSKGLYSISVNGQELLFYWPQTEAKEIPSSETTPAAPAPQPETALDKIQQMNASLVSDTSNRLQVEKPAPVYVPQPQQPLSGTRLYQPPQKQTNFRRAHNALMETVEQQRYAAKYEAPGAVVSAGAPLKDVANPVDAFKRCLTQVCQSEESCRQAVESLLSCPGMRQAIVSSVSDTKRDLTVTAMHSQLQELEAERLMLLMQLDDAKKNTAAYREEALAEVLSQEKNNITALQTEKEKLSKEIADQQTILQNMQAVMDEGADALKNCLEHPYDILLSRKMGIASGKVELTARLETALKAAGFLCEPGDALAMLTAYAIESKNLAILADTQEDAFFAAEVFASVFDAPVSSTHENVKLAPGGNTPVFLLGGCNRYCTRVSAGIGTKESIPSYNARNTILFTLHQDPAKMPGKLPSFPAVSAASLKGTFVKEDKLSEETLAVLSSLRQADKKNPLPLNVLQNTISFIASTQNAFKGGLAESIDRAVSIFILPYFMEKNTSSDALLPLIAAMPRSISIWNNRK